MHTRACKKPLRETTDVEGFADESPEPYHDYVPDPLETIKRTKYTQAAWGDVFEGACDGVHDDISWVVLQLTRAHRRWISLAGSYRYVTKLI